MRKKFVKVMLFGALTLAAGASFVGCKDYDDDINNLQTQITANADAIKQLKDLIGAGKFVTNVVKEGDGIKITWNDNTSTVIQSIKGDTGAAGKDGTLVTIVDGYWAFDGVKSTYPATGAKGDAGPAGADGKPGANGADGHDAKISADGYWMVWDATKGEYVKTEYIASGASAVEGDFGWTIRIKDEKTGEYMSIVVPNSAQLLSITPELNGQTYAQNFNIYYGILNQDITWEGHKAVNGKMQAGMYPTTDRDIKILLNPAGVNGAAYEYSFLSTDNTQPWGLTFKGATPWIGKATVETRAAATSQNGLWALPHDAQRVDMNSEEYQGRPDYALQFKSNDGVKYMFALQAKVQVKADASAEEKAAAEKAAVKSPYVYTFKANNINSVENINIDGLTFQPSGKSFVYGKEYTPTFDMLFKSSNDYEQLAEDSVLVYDYYLEIDKTKITDESIRKYGLNITSDGYRFIAKNAAVVNNTVWFKYNYILINGKTGSASFGINFNDEETAVTSKFIGDFTAPFNAVVSENPQWYTLSNTFDLTNFFTSLGASGKLKWIDALARNIQGAGAATDPQEIQSLIFDKKTGSGDASYSVELLGGDPINNQASWDKEAYNATLLGQYIDFDYVDAQGNSCLTGTIRDLDKIAALKVTFKVNRDLGRVSAPYYTVDNKKYNGQGVALPLNNSFRVGIATRFDQYEVSKMDFTFELNMPTNCPIKRESVGNQTCIWDENALTVYGQKLDDNRMAGDLRDAFKGAFIYQNQAYKEKTIEANWYDVALGTRSSSDRLIDMKYDGDQANLGKITNSSVYTTWNTIGYYNSSTFANWNVKDVKYHHFNVYTESLEDFTVKFASKIEDSKTFKSKGTETNPFLAKAIYDADNKNVLRYEFSVSNSDFTMADAFNNSYDLFDGSGLRANSYKNLREDLQGIVTDKTTPSYYGLYPSAKVDGKSTSLVTFALDSNAPATKTTKMTITIDKSAGIEKVFEITYTITDVFGHKKALTFYALTQNK